MLKNYCLIAWRNISRHKTQTVINVVGLALGMTCCLFILMWVKDEERIDNFHAQGENIYSVYQTVTSKRQNRRILFHTAYRSKRSELSFLFIGRCTNCRSPGEIPGILCHGI